jgi:ABC-2 type transport system permease protein
LSPIGWAQATYVYVDNRWWPLLLCLSAGIALAAAAFRLSTRRDVGAGLRATRAGRAAASRALGHPVAFVLRLQRSVLIGFVVALALTGLSYGSFLADVDELLANVDGADEVVAAMGGDTLVDSFIALVSVVMSILSSIFVVLVILRMRAEEDAGRAELVLSTPLRRARWLGSHLVVATAGGGVLLLAAAVGLGLAGAGSTGDSTVIGTALLASMVYLPAQWVVAGVAAALVGWFPRAAALAWLVPAYAFLVGYLGELLQFPGWAENLSPFGFVPRVPAENPALLPLIGLAAVAAGLVALGIVGLNRRDVGRG